MSAEPAPAAAPAPSAPAAAAPAAPAATSATNAAGADTGAASTGADTAGKAAPARSGPLSLAEKIAKGVELKNQGNAHFKAKAYGKAARSYNRVFAYVNGLHGAGDPMGQYAAEHLSGAQEGEIQRLKLAVWGNLPVNFPQRALFSRNESAALPQLRARICWDAHASCVASRSPSP